MGDRAWRNRLVRALYHTAWVGADWLFPPTCAGCQQPGTRWCASCQSSSQALSDNTCPRCGLPKQKTSLCPSCRAKVPAYEALRSWGVYVGPLRNAIIQLKYHRNLGVAEPLARLLLDTYSHNGWQVDLLVPVPLGRTRLHERGYNQANVLARPLSFELGLPLHPEALTRFRETRSQVGLSSQERSVNMEGAFRANPKILHNRTVLLVDDVATTGSTTNACACALKEAGAKAVYVLTLARAVRLSDHVEQPV